jgi:hypothetical protein
LNGGGIAIAALLTPSGRIWAFRLTRDQAAIMWRIGQPASIFLAALCCALAAQAEAQEYCVACTGPNAVYRCVIDGAQPGGSQPLQMMCITTMAKEGGHATCGIKRGTVFDCDGPVKRIPWAALNAPAQPAPSQQSAVQPLAPSTAPAASPKPDPQEPPQTVLEMAKRANEKTAEQMKKANENMKESARSTGEALAKATKKTWECVSSFFTRCKAAD